MSSRRTQRAAACSNGARERPCQRARQRSVLLLPTLASVLLASLLAYAAPAPPRGTPAEAFLAAFVSRRRDRDRDRLAAEVSRRRALTSPGDA